MRSLLYFSVILLFIFFFTSCSNKQYQTLFQQQKIITDTSLQKNAVTLNQYHIKSQDILQIRNLQDMKFIANQLPPDQGSGGGGTSMGQSYQVEADGAVALPVIGRVQVAGLTRVEAQQLVENLYRKVLLNNPIIELKIINLKVTLLGEVKAQGSYNLVKDKTTLVELIGEAGGISEKADERTVKIIRGTERNPQVTIIDLNDISSINDPKAVLQSGDIIYIAQNKRAVRSDNLQSLTVLVQPALLLFNTALIIFTLIRK